MIKSMTLLGGVRYILASRLGWNTVFNRLREGLPSLKTFVFTRGPWDHRTAFSQRDSNVSQFLARRYLSYHEGVLPSVFIEPVVDLDYDETKEYIKYRFRAFDHYKSTPSADKMERQEHERLQPPSNDPKVYRAELEAFNTLNEALSKRR